MENSILPTGVLIFKNSINLKDYEIELLVNASENIKFNNKMISNEIKNSLWTELKKTNNEKIIEYIQKNILKSLVKYIDIYEEAIHVIQWQEEIKININYPGENKEIFNPNKSYISNNEIYNTPFSRQIVVEVAIESNYEGGSISWNYFNENYIKLNAGDILIYPANYLWSYKESPIINGRKIFLSTFFNGGKDFIAEKHSIDTTDNQLMFSYMR